MVSITDCYLDKKSRLSRKMYLKYVKSLSLSQINITLCVLCIKISTGEGNSKPSFFIEGGIHSREWISPATVLYMAGQVSNPIYFQTCFHKYIHCKCLNS